jgi:ferredoxin
LEWGDDGTTGRSWRCVAPLQAFDGYSMAAKNPYRPFTPDPEFMALWPEGYDGNAINGVGESEVRRPSMVWWTPDMETAVFGPLQKWFYGRERPDDTMSNLRKARIEAIKRPDPPVASERVERSPADWTALLQHFVQSGDCDRVGVARMRPEWVFDHVETGFENVIVFGLQHEYEELRHVPALRGGTDVTRQYLRAALVSKKVAAWLRLQGWDAEPMTGPMTSKIVMIPAAIACGFGELGKHGSIINKEWGSAFRLSAVLTNAPLAITPRREFGVDDFCRHCRVCEDACPPLAIGPDKKMVRGEMRWSVDFNACIPFFAESSGCAICIAVCPWSRPGVGLNLAAKLEHRAKRSV